MNKLAIIAILASVTAAASAADVGVRVGRDNGTDTNNAGVTVGQKFGDFGAEAAFDRSTVGKNNVNRWSLVGSYSVDEVAGVSVAAKAGAAFIDPTHGDNGAALLVGVGASYPVTNSVSLVADYAFRKGQERVRAYDGNIVSVGVKVSF